LEDVDSNVKLRSGPGALPEDERIRKLFEATIKQNSVDRVLLLHPFYYAIGALDACRARGIPCSVYFHGLELRSQLRGQYPRALRELVETRRIGTLRERVFYTVSVCDEILVNSSYTASIFGGFDEVPALRVTGCGIPDHDYHRELDATPVYDAALKAKRREQFGLGKKPCLAFVGRLVPAKRVDKMLAILRACPDLTAMVVGAGPQQAELSERARAWGISDRLRFLGQVSESQKWATLRAADFNCLLSEPNQDLGAVEGFGIALLEGAAAGAVPVSSGTGGMTDVVSHQQTGVVAPFWPADAAQLLLGLAADEASMKKLVFQAREQLASRFTWESVAAQVVGGWA
jgi:glycosyltransferase involved in cell wall biosynthesis